MRLKNLTEILSNLVDETIINTTAINDFTVGSTILSIYEAVAMELEQYYVLSSTNIMNGIEEGVYEAFGFKRKVARKAYGDITLTFNTVPQSNVYIPRGTTFTSNVAGVTQRFETLKDYVALKGKSTATITVHCTEAGTVGNLGAGVINSMVNSLSNIKKVQNRYAFLTGQEEEELAAVKKRFQTYIATLGKATVGALDYAVRSLPDVEGTYIKPEVGHVSIYAHDLNGTLSGELKAAIETVIEDYRPAGIPVDIYPVVLKYVDVVATVSVPKVSARTPLFKNEIKDSITRYLNSFTSSDDLVLAELTQRIMGIDDYEIYDVVLNNLTSNLIVEDNELIRAGTVTVNFKEV